MVANMEKKKKCSRKNTTKRWRDSQPIRCRVQNTGNQDAHRIGWVWLQNRGKSEGHEEWNKGKYTRNQQWREGNWDSNSLELKEEINTQPEQNEETRIQKIEKRLRNLWDNFKCSNIQIIGVPEGEEEEQEIQNLLEKILKKNFPNLAKEIDFHEVQEAQSPKEVRPKEAHTKAHHNYIP